MQSTENRTIAAEVIAALLVASYESIDINELAEHYKLTEDQALAVLWEVGTASAAIYWDDLLDEDDPLAHVAVGDEDPNECGDDEDCCAAAQVYLCTRLFGHPGQHIAGDGVEVLAVWE